MQDGVIREEQRRFQAQRKTSSWRKVKRNHRNEALSMRIPPIVEQWWVEPPSMSQILGDLRRSLMREGREGREPRRV